MPRGAELSTTSRQRRLRDELRATLAAYHELGPEYEPQVVESFIDRTRPLFRRAAPETRERRASRQVRGSPPRGLLIAAAALLAWFALAGHVFGGWRYPNHLDRGWYQSPAPVAPANPAPPPASTEGR